MLMGYSPDSKNHNLNLGPNDYVMQSLAGNAIASQSVEKLGRDFKKSSLNLRLNPSTQVVDEYDSFQIVEVEINGTIKNTEGTFPVYGKDHLYLVQYKGRQIFFGNMTVDIKNIKGTEEGVLSIRYEPDAGRADVTLTSGAIGDTAMVAFGELFLTKQEVADIDAILQKPVQ